MKTMKRVAAAVCAAITLFTPLTVDAHILSSKQEKNIGTKAAKKYEEKYRCREDAIITHIQGRIMAYNRGKLLAAGCIAGAVFASAGMPKVLRVVGFNELDRWGVPLNHELNMEQKLSFVRLVARRRAFLCAEKGGGYEIPIRNS